MAIYTLTTLLQLVTRLGELVGNNTIFWTFEEKRDAINEAISVWQCLTGWWDDLSIPVTPTQQIPYVQVPRQLAAVSQVKYNGVTLIPFSLAELDQTVPGWSANATLGTPLYWAPVGVGEIALYPTPTVPLGVVTFEGYREAPLLRSEGDFLQLSDDVLVALLLYAHHYLSFKEGGAELNSTLENVKTLVQEAANCNDELLLSQTYRKYMGLVKDESLRPVRAGTEKVGVREIGA